MRPGVPPQAKDGPARLLDFVLGWMPKERSEWAEAMQAELAQVEGSGLRWSFALGCVRAVVLVPRRNEDKQPRAAGAALFVLPFVVLNAIVANRIQPFFGMIRPGEHTSVQEYVLLAVSLLLLPLGAYQLLRPMLREWAAGKRHVIVWKTAVALLICAAFVAISVELGTEIYRCDVLGIAQCD